MSAPDGPCWVVGCYSKRQLPYVQKGRGCVPMSTEMAVELRRAADPVLWTLSGAQGVSPVSKTGLAGTLSARELLCYAQTVLTQAAQTQQCISVSVPDGSSARPDA